MVIGNTPKEIKWVITQATDGINSFVVEDTNGDPVDISIYEFYFEVRRSADVYSESMIEILNANIAQSDSGTGTTDTFTIDITNSLSGIAKGTYYYDIRSKVISTGDNDVWFNGVFEVLYSVQEAR